MIVQILFLHFNSHLECRVSYVSAVRTRMSVQKPSTCVLNECSVCDAGVPHRNSCGNRSRCTVSVFSLRWPGSMAELGFMCHVTTAASAERCRTGGIWSLNVWLKQLTTSKVLRYSKRLCHICVCVASGLLVLSRQSCWSSGNVRGRRCSRTLC